MTRLLNFLSIVLRIGSLGAFVMLSLTRISVADDELDTSLSVLRDLERYCVECHGDDGEGKVSLVGFTDESLSNNAALVRKLIHVLDTRQMPPEGEPEPASEERERWIGNLRRVLHAAVLKSPATRTPIRRMNRFQYNNAVIDLFELNCNVFTLPERAMRVHDDYFDPASGKMPDKVTVGNRPLGKSQMIEPRLGGVAAFPQDLRAEHGYDNRADHLSLSPLLMEAFLRLGQSVTQSPDFEPKRVGIWDQFFASPTEDADISREIPNRLRRFLTKAFRRPAEDALVERYTQFATEKLAAGWSFTETMKAVAAATIASPRFLYLYDTTTVAETNEEDEQQTINDVELASRLSFFLWGSLPDEVLLTLADQGRLGSPEVLLQQIDRLLTDKKVKRFCDSFPTQWLQLDRIVSSTPNRERFPEFYFSKYRLSMHMMLEPLLLFETVLIEDRSITQLIDPDFTYRSVKLQQTYTTFRPPGEPVTGKSTGGDVTVLSFHRLPITDRREGGVITNAAVMTMTAGVEQTKPITRGAWMAGVIFNDPPEPPPANVPPLPATPPEGEERLSLRERFAAHRERSDCRGCHETIDPLGFALENYDPMGRWRDEYENGAPVDASGTLFRQHAFSDVVEFKDAILADKDRFCRALAEHLLAFAVARELGPADALAIDEITKAVAGDGYKMKTLIRQVILSKPFRTKS